LSQLRSWPLIIVPPTPSEASEAAVKVIVAAVVAEDLAATEVVGAEVVGAEVVGVDAVDAAALIQLRY
jgi:hypothetical protein